MEKLNLILTVKKAMKHSRTKILLFVLLLFLAVIGVALVGAAIYSVMNMHGSVTV